MPKKIDARQKVKRPARIEDGLIYLPLTNGKEAFLDDTPDNRDLVLCRSWLANTGGYAASTISNKTVMLHRLLMPGVAVVDHVNRNVLDNRACNLREASRSQNRMNSRTTAKSGFKGVYAHYTRGKFYGRWAAQMGLGGRTLYLGLFNSPEEAHAAWLEAAWVRDPDFMRSETVKQ